MEEAYLNGYFQSDRYFGDPSVRETLGEIFAENIRRRMSGGGPAGFAAAAERIMADGEHAVSLHIRRGDYLLAEPAKTHGGICTEHYYGEAVTLVRGSVPDAVFYVFSDDAAYAAQFAQEGEAAGRGRFVPVCSLLSGETEGPAEIDAASLLLMRLCRLPELVVNGDKIVYILFLAVIAPTGVLVTQIAQLYHQDAEYASAINVVTTLFCIVTMPLMTWIYFL